MLEVEGESKRGNHRNTESGLLSASHQPLVRIRNRLQFCSFRKLDLKSKPNWLNDGYSRPCSPSCKATSIVVSTSTGFPSNKVG